MHTKVKYSQTECIVRYLKTNDSFVETFSLDCEQYSAFNYIPYQLTDVRRFCVEDQGILSTDTTFKICEGLNISHLLINQVETIHNSQSLLFAILKKTKRHTEDLQKRYLFQIRHWQESK